MSEEPRYMRIPSTTRQPGEKVAAMWLRVERDHLADPDEPGAAGAYAAARWCLGVRDAPRPIVGTYEPATSRWLYEEAAYALIASYGDRPGYDPDRAYGASAWLKWWLEEEDDVGG